MRVVALWVLSVAALALSCRGRRREIPPQDVAPVDDVLARQLIWPPAESAAVLDAIDRGAPPPPFRAGEADASKLAWGGYVTRLKEAYRPSAQVPFVAFAKEAGRFDVVRARYRGPPGPSG